MINLSYRTRRPLRSHSHLVPKQSGAQLSFCFFSRRSPLTQESRDILSTLLQKTARSCGSKQRERASERRSSTDAPREWTCVLPVTARSPRRGVTPRTVTAGSHSLLSRTVWFSVSPETSLTVYLLAARLPSRRVGERTGCKRRTQKLPRCT